MRVKICGLTNLPDALTALEAGADLLGFNFYPKSPRSLTPAACVEIMRALRATPERFTAVGVFVNEPPERVQAILDECGLDLAQLHGDETPEAIRALNGRAFKALRGAGERLADYVTVSPSTPAGLIDAYSPALYGGTGQTADWSAARTVAAQYPILLAGGLTPENVAAAIAQVRPWGVDVASGVEAAPGRKDSAKVLAFLQAVHSADPQRQTR